MVSWGVGLVVGARIIRIDFPMPSKTHQVKVAAQRHPLCFSVTDLQPSSKSSKKTLFKPPWLHFSEVSHSSGRGFSISFRGCSGSWRRAFTVGLAVDDELMSAMAEAVQSALAKQRFIEDRHPFLHAAIGGENRRTASVAFNQQIVEIGGRLAGQLAQSEVVDHEKIRINEGAQLAVERVIRTRAGQSLQQLIGFSE